MKHSRTQSYVDGAQVLQFTRQFLGWSRRITILDENRLAARYRRRLELIYEVYLSICI